MTDNQIMSGIPINQCESEELPQNKVRSNISNEWWNADISNFFALNLFLLPSFVLGGKRCFSMCEATPFLSQYRFLNADLKSSDKFTCIWLIINLLLHTLLYTHIRHGIEQMQKRKTFCVFFHLFFENPEAVVIEINLIFFKKKIGIRFFLYVSAVYCNSFKKIVSFTCMINLLIRPKPTHLYIYYKYLLAEFFRLEISHSIDYKYLWLNWISCLIVFIFKQLKLQIY